MPNKEDLNKQIAEYAAHAKAMNGKFAELLLKFQNAKEKRQVSETEREKMAVAFLTYEKTIKEMQSEIQELKVREGRAGALDMFGGSTCPDSMYKQLEEKIKSFAGGERKRNSAEFQVKGFEHMMRMAYHNLKSTELGDTELGAARRPDHLAGIVNALPLRLERVEDLFPKVGNTSGKFTFVRTSVLRPLYTELTVETTSGGSTITVSDASGFFPGQTITILTTEKIIAAAGVNYTTGVITLTTTVGAVIIVGSGVFADQATGTPELVTAPAMRVETEEVADTVRNIIGKMPISWDQLDDAEGLMSFIQLMMPLVLGQNTDRELLNGSGSGREMTGILQTTNVGAYSWSSGNPGDTKADAIRRGATVASRQNIKPNGLVISIGESEDLDLLKTDDGNYMFHASPNGEGTVQPWGLRTVETGAMADGTALVGAFAGAARVHVRADTTIQFLDQHSDYADRDLVLVKAKRRIGLSVEVPRAFVAITFNSAPV